MVERALRLGKACGRVDRTYVSTDDAEIQAIAAANGCATPSLRPASMSTDAARTIDGIPVIVDVLPAVLAAARAADLRFVTLRLALS